MSILSLLGTPAEFLDKGKPIVRSGRKAMDLITETARLPMELFDNDPYRSHQSGEMWVIRFILPGYDSHEDDFVLLREDRGDDSSCPHV